MSRLLPLSLLTLGILLASAGSLWISFRALNVPIAFASALLLNSVSAVSRLLNVTPGAFGVREGLIGGLALVIQIDFEMAIIASMIDRFVQMLVLFGLAGLFFTMFASNVASED